jgi:hypothetical protein
MNMRSPTGLAAAVILLLAVPLALGSQILVDGSAEFVLHLVVGTGCIALALAMFDFGLPRWVDLLGAAAAGAFGSIFLLQAISQLVQIEALTYVAYDILGQEIERVLPYVVLVWFVALLLWGSHGKSRILGGAVLAVVIGVEVVSFVGPLVGIDIESQKLLFLLPFIWLLAESIERRPDGDMDQAPATVIGQPPQESMA